MRKQADVIWYRVYESVHVQQRCQDLRVLDAKMNHFGK